jgi:hypothetical protein
LLNVGVQIGALLALPLTIVPNQAGVGVVSRLFTSLDKTFSLYVSCFQLLTGLSDSCALRLKLSDCGNCEVTLDVILNIRKDSSEHVVVLP